MRHTAALLLVPALIALPAIAVAQQGGRGMYENGSMRRLSDCMADGMIVGGVAGLVVGMFQTDRTNARVPVMAFWGAVGLGAGIWGGLGYWAVHEIRRDRAMNRERADTVTTPGPRMQSDILRKRPCRGAIPFTSGPRTPPAAREGSLPWVREPY